MNTKIVTSKEFTNNWFRTGKDTDDNVLSTMICGGNVDRAIGSMFQKSFKKVA